MGTRADFYVGRGKEAEWLGSIAWDGDPDSVGHKENIKLAGGSLLKPKSEADFRSAVANFVINRDDGTKPSMGWPWPWEDSNTTDFAYAFDDDQVWVTCFGNGWWDARKPMPEQPPTDTKVEFPNMNARQRITFGKRSGIIILGGVP